MLHRRSVRIYLALTAGLLLLSADAFAQKNQKRQRRNRQQSNQQQSNRNQQPPAQAGLPAPPEAARRIDKTLMAWDTAEARRQLGESLPPTDPWHGALSGRVLAQEKRYAEAETALRAAADALPRDPAPLVALGESLLDAGRADAARQAFDRAAERAAAAVTADAGDVRAHYLLGVARQRQMRYADATQSLERARELSPADPMPVYQLGVTKAFAQEYAAAIPLFDRAIEMNPRIAYAYFYRGLSASKVDRKDLLVNDMHRFLDLAPDSPEAPTARRILEAAY